MARWPSGKASVSYERGFEPAIIYSVLYCLLFIVLPSNVCFVRRILFEFFAHLAASENLFNFSGLQYELLSMIVI